MDAQTGTPLTPLYSREHPAAAAVAAAAPAENPSAASVGAATAGAPPTVGLARSLFLPPQMTTPMGGVAPAPSRAAADDHADEWPQRHGRHGWLWSHEMHGVHLRPPWEAWVALDHPPTLWPPWEAWVLLLSWEAWVHLRPPLKILPTPSKLHVMRCVMRLGRKIHLRRRKNRLRKMRTKTRKMMIDVSFIYMS
ncbi:hypothetical protein D1007_17226 [Hordeum vulgare]|nr:hypothetical protein D1007_17226 [Hordeum vulgare]